jgi:hypothetical protein
MMCLSICAVAMHDPSSGFVVWVDASCHPGALFDGSEKKKRLVATYSEGSIVQELCCIFLSVQLLQ